MRILVALGGNALLKRGEPMTADVQRANIRTAARSLAPVAEHHQLVLSHGNGPQVGLLALQAAAYKEVEAYPLGRPRRPDGGDDRLSHRAGARQPAARRGPVRHDPDDDRGRRRRSGVRRPDQVRRTGLRGRRRRRVGRREGMGLQARRREASPRRPVAGAQADLRDPAHPLAARARRARHLRRRRRDPDDLGARPGTHARRRRGGHRQGPGQRAARSRDRRRPVPDGHGRRRRVRELGDG